MLIKLREAANLADEPDSSNLWIRTSVCHERHALFEFEFSSSAPSVPWTIFSETSGIIKETESKETLFS